MVSVNEIRERYDIQTLNIDEESKSEVSRELCCSIMRKQPKAITNQTDASYKSVKLDNAKIERA